MGKRRQACAGGSFWARCATSHATKTTRRSRLRTLCTRATRGLPPSAHDAQPAQRPARGGTHVHVACTSSSASALHCSSTHSSARAVCRNPAHLRRLLPPRAASARRRPFPGLRCAARDAGALAWASKGVPAARRRAAVPPKAKRHAARAWLPESGDRCCCAPRQPLLLRSREAWRFGQKHTAEFTRTVTSSVTCARRTSGRSVARACATRRA